MEVYKITDHPLGKQYISVLNILVNNIEHLAKNSLTDIHNRVTKDGKPILKQFNLSTKSCQIQYFTDRLSLIVKKYYEHYQMRIVHTRDIQNNPITAVPSEFLKYQIFKKPCIVHNEVSIIIREVYDLLKENNCVMDPVPIIRRGTFFSDKDDYGKLIYRYGR